MPTGPRVLLDNVCYHLIIRGNHKLKVFRCDQDYTEYLQRLITYKRIFGFRLYAFCLMPNHIHLLGEIYNVRHLARFMQGLNRSYTEYYNKTYDKEGHLWQGRFKSKIVAKDAYLLNCVNYIEDNPVKAEIAESLEEYKWTSYTERVLEAQKTKGLLDDIRL